MNMNMNMKMTIIALLLLALTTPVHGAYLEIPPPAAVWRVSPSYIPLEKPTVTHSGLEVRKPFVASSTVPIEEARVIALKRLIKELQALLEELKARQN